MKRLRYELDKCTACQACALACSLVKIKASNPFGAAIRVYRNPFKQEENVLFCEQCGDSFCMNACPTGALYDGEGELEGAVLFNDELCTVCGLCVEACPYDAITIFTEPDEEGLIIKCDLCRGNPQCVPVCRTEALVYD